MPVELTTATLNSIDIATPIRNIARRQKNTAVLLGEPWPIDAAAGVAWLGFHIHSLIGFRNRLLVMIERVWTFVTWQLGARLVTGRSALER